VPVAAPPAAGAKTAPAAVPIDAEVVTLIAAEAARSGVDADEYACGAIRALFELADAVPRGSAVTIAPPATTSVSFAKTIWPAMRAQLSVSTVVHDGREVDDAERTGLGPSRVVRRAMDRERRRLAVQCAAAWHDFDFRFSGGEPAAAAAGRVDRATAVAALDDLVTVLAAKATGETVQVRTECLSALVAAVETVGRHGDGGATSMAAGAADAACAAAVRSLADQKYLRIRTHAVEILEGVATLRPEAIAASRAALERAVLAEEDIAVKERLRDVLRKLGK
jgi:hypothetical protein